MVIMRHTPLCKACLHRTYGVDKQMRNRSHMLAGNPRQQVSACLQTPLKSCKNLPDSLQLQHTTASAIPLTSSRASLGNGCQLVSCASNIHAEACPMSLSCRFRVCSIQPLGHDIVASGKICWSGFRSKYFHGSSNNNVEDISTQACKDSPTTFNLCGLHDDGTQDS